MKKGDDQPDAKFYYDILQQKMSKPIKRKRKKKESSELEEEYEDEYDDEVP
jgi:hypothetical protein